LQLNFDKRPKDVGLDSQD